MQELYLDDRGDPWYVTDAPRLEDRRDAGTQ
jgi:hypothetical protein